jgi:hypothetical protein
LAKWWIATTEVRQPSPIPISTRLIDLGTA